MQMIHDAVSPEMLALMKEHFQREEVVETAQDKAKRLSDELCAKHDRQAEAEERLRYQMRKLKEAAR